MSYYLIEPLFGNAVKHKALRWLIKDSIPHQFVYTPDAARLFYQLVYETNLPEFYLLNYGGRVVSSIKYFAQQINIYSGNDDKKLLVAPKLFLLMMGYLSKDLKELRENFYQFENTILLDDSQLYSQYPGFKSTSLTVAIQKTLDWFSDQ